MEIKAAQFAKIQDCLPTQRGTVGVSTLHVLSAILFVVEHGCKWRGLPKRFGNWHPIYTRMNRWSKAGVLDCVFERLQQSQIVRLNGWRRVFSRFEKLDPLFIGFVNFVLIADGLHRVDTP
jgi:transposase